MVRQVVKCESGTNIHFKVINSRLIIINPLDNNSEVYKDKDLVGLNYDDEVSCQVGEILTIKGHAYKPATMKRINVSDNYQYGQGYYLYNSVLTKSARFILPLLGGKKSDYLWDTNLMNVFIGLENEDVCDYIYLWYRYTPSVSMQNLEEMVLSHPQFDTHMDIDNQHVLYRMKIPEKYKADYDLIVRGKYSRIHQDTKDRVLQFHNESISSVIGQILYRALKRREKMERDLGEEIDPQAELYDIFDPHQEIFKMDYILENVDTLKTASIEEKSKENLKTTKND